MSAYLFPAGQEFPGIFSLRPSFCTLDSYKGRGSLIGWLRTTIAQRYVDHHRRTRREVAMEDQPEGFEPVAAETGQGKPAAEVLILAHAIEDVFLGLHEIDLHAELARSLRYLRQEE